MGDNLPPGVTPGDIDDHYGEPRTRTIVGEVSVAVTVEVIENMDESQIRDELLRAAEKHRGEAVHAEIIEER